jgi:hypothetical protein
MNVSEMILLAMAAVASYCFVANIPTGENGNLAARKGVDVLSQKLFLVSTFLLELAKLHDAKHSIQLVVMCAIGQKL